MIKDRFEIFKLCQKTAEERQGHCLSDTYVIATEKLKWQCQKGHIWEATWHNIRAGKWCPICSIDVRANKRRFSLLDCEKAAKAFGGLCLSKKYVDSKDKLQWQCSEGHKFFAAFVTVKQGAWCRKCFDQRHAKENLELRISNVQKFVSQRKGKFLYVDQKDSTFVHLKCEKGHAWKTRASTLIRLKTWCPKCAGVALLSIEDAREMAISFGGICLSNEYINCDTKLSFQCRFGHQFMQTLTGMKVGKFCGICGKAKASLRSAQFWATKKSGKCLSKFFEGDDFSKKIVLLECHRKHQWLMSLSDLRRGHWCPDCARDSVRKFT